MNALLLLALLASAPTLDDAALHKLGLTPARIAPGQLVGRWARSDGPSELVEVSAGPTPQSELQGWPGLDHMGRQSSPLGRAHLHPDARSISADELRFDCGMNHYDPPVYVYWLATSPDALIRVVNSGWGPELQVARFRRARPGEPFDPSRPPHADPAPPEHAERRDRW